MVKIVTLRMHPHEDEMIRAHAKTTGQRPADIMREAVKNHVLEGAESDPELRAIAQAAAQAELNVTLGKIATEFGPSYVEGLIFPEATEVGDQP